MKSTSRTGRIAAALVLSCGPSLYLACGEDLDSPGPARGLDASGSSETSTTTDSAIDAATKPFTSVLDLDAIEGLAGQTDVMTWLDRSLKNNTAAAAVGPLPVELGIYGKPAVRFDGTKYLTLADSESLQFGSSDFLIEVVVKFEASDTATSHVIFTKQLGADPLTGPALLANHAFLPGAATDRSTTIAGLLSDGTKTSSIAVRAVPVPEDTKPHLVALRRTANILEIRVDRQARGTKLFSAADFGAVGAAAFLGGDGKPGRGLKGYISAIEIYKGKLPDRDLGDVEGRLTNRYLQPPPDAGPGDGGDSGDGG